jgi:hypothetical protein
MKINLPSTYNDITLDEYVKYHSLKSEIDKIALITGLSKKSIEGLQVSAIETIITEYSNALERGTPRMDYVIKGDVELAFVPDIDAITLREHIDLDTYAQSIWKNGAMDCTNLPNLMAILYRPISKRFGKWYELQAYDVDKVKYYIDSINTMTMAQVNGVMVFFSTILSELVQNSLDYLEQEKSKMINQLEAMI